MSVPLFSGDGTRREDTTILPRSRRTQFLRPENFRPDQGVVDAVNVALLLGQPLLLTGEPGTGKTQLGHYIAWELGLGDALKYETKSTSTAGSLFYSYDALKRFQHVQTNVRHDSALPYITYHALGKAILLTRDPAEVAPYLPEGFLHGGRTRSLVIIDEIDKAPRDFPNDILNELDQLYFRIPELDNQPIRVDESLRPVVVITSNSEKDLPDAFLRRCIFYHIPFPTPEQMLAIVSTRLGIYTGDSDAFLAEALELFYQLREKASMRKKPSTAELLEFISAMMSAADDAPNPLAVDPGVASRSLSALTKTVEDQEKAARIVDEWVRRR